MRRWVGGQSCAKLERGKTSQTTNLQGRNQNGGEGKGASDKQMALHGPRTTFLISNNFFVSIKFSRNEQEREPSCKTVRYEIGFQAFNLIPSMFLSQ